MLLKDLFKQQKTAPSSFAGIKSTSDATFIQDVVEASATLPVFVDFWAPWCEPCKQLTPLLEKMSKEFSSNIIFTSYNIDESSQIARQLGIQSAPTVIIFKNGQPIDGFVGLIMEKDLRSLCKKFDTLPKGEEELLSQAHACFLKDEYELSLSYGFQVLGINENNLNGLEICAKNLIALNRFDEANSIIVTLKNLSASPTLLEALDIFISLKTRETDTEIKEHLHKNLYLKLTHLLLENFQNNPQKKEASKKLLVEIFTALGHDHPTSIQGRKLLSTLLFS